MKHQSKGKEKRNLQFQVESMFDVKGRSLHQPRLFHFSKQTARGQTAAGLINATGQRDAG